jgi:serine/threonine protein kinase
MELDQEKSNYYLNEVRNLSDLYHENIIRYFGSWIEFGEFTFDDLEDDFDAKIKKGTHIIPILYIQMEMCDTNLASFIESRNYRSSFDFDEGMRIFESILEGVEYIHEKDIIHRDLSPKNIFLDQNLCVKIGDFGLSRKTESNDSVSSDYYGNMIYMAPEDRDNFICTKKSDVYSLGIILMELLVPFNTMMERMVSIGALRDGEWEKFPMIKPQILEVIKKMMDKNPDKRPSVEDVIDQLYGF